METQLKGSAGLVAGHLVWCPRDNFGVVRHSERGGAIDPLHALGVKAVLVWVRDALALNMNDIYGTPR